MPMPRPCHFEALWHAFRRNQGAAAGIAEANRAAFLTSMTLGVTPREPGELAAFGNPRLVDPFAPGPSMERFYLRADQLTARLRREWGQPDVFLEGADPESYLSRRRGLLYFENRLHSGRHAYAKQAHRIVSQVGLPLYSPFAEKVEGTVTGIDVTWPASTGHIDLWNGRQTGRGFQMDTIREAELVWLWIAP
jgi:hypothetical protein